MKTPRRNRGVSVGRRQAERTYCPVGVTVLAPGFALVVSTTAPLTATTAPGAPGF